MLTVTGGAVLYMTHEAWRSSAAYAADRYPSNSAMYADPALVEGIDYGRRYRRHAAVRSDPAERLVFPETVVLAIHGGGIEPGTSELCLGIAGYHPASFITTPGQPTYDYWMFEGLRASNNAELHVTATSCDDPIALSLSAGARRVLSLHGCTPAQLGLTDDSQAVFVGGRDIVMRDRLAKIYLNIGIQTLTEDAGNFGLEGSNQRNIVNRSLTAAGVQVELTTPLRAAMFGTNTRAQRKNTTSELFWRFVNATRKAREQGMVE
jgi:phage replication-related protein YjqB (UPF0714/DUF867 family)